MPKCSSFQRCYRFYCFWLFDRSLQNFEGFDCIFSPIDFFTMAISSYMSLFPTFSAFNTRTFLPRVAIPFTIAASSRHITIFSHMSFILTIEADKSLFCSRLGLPLLSLLRWLISRYFCRLSLHG